MPGAPLVASCSVRSDMYGFTQDQGVQASSTDERVVKAPFHPKTGTQNPRDHICATAFIWYLAQIHYLLCGGRGGPISFRLLKQEVMSQYLTQTTLVANHTISFRLLYIVTSNKSISFMWGPYLVHKRILMIDKQIEHAVDYYLVMPK